jgi:hypothetical protein
MQHVIAEAATQQTDTELIAAPGAGKTIQIYGFFFSTDSAIKFTVEHGSTAIHAQWTAAGGGSIIFPDTPGITAPWASIPANTAVTYTTSGASNVVVEAWYEIREA